MFDQSIHHLAPLTALGMAEFEQPGLDIRDKVLCAWLLL